jgi:hypothetical protein
MSRYLRLSGLGDFVPSSERRELVCALHLRSVFAGSPLALGS